MILFENSDIIQKNLDSLHLKDSTQERKELVDTFLRAHPFAQKIYALAEPTLKITAFRFVVFLLCYVYYYPRGLLRRDLCGETFFFKNTNEKKLIPVLHSKVFLTHLKSSFVDKLLNLMLVLVDGLFLFKAYNRFLKKHPKNMPTDQLFIYVRSCEYLVWILVGSRLLATSKISTVMVSTEGNPHGLALLACAKIFEKKSVFLSHAHFPLTVAPFTAEIALLHGNAAKQIYLTGGCHFEKTYLYLHKLPQFTYPLPSRRPRVLLAPSKRFSWNQLTSLLKINNDCDFYVRYHPTSMDIRRARREQPTSIIGEASESLEMVAKRVDLVWAGNSNVHLDFLSLNTPSFYVHEIENLSAARLPFLSSTSLILNWNSNLDAAGNLKSLIDHSKTTHWASEYEAQCNTLDTEIQCLTFIRDKESEL